MEKKTTYKCGLCGKEYETIPERARCEAACVDKQLAMEEKAKKEKQKQAQEAERKAIVAEIMRVGEMVDAYTDKYGSFTYSTADFAEPEKKEEPKVKTETVSKSVAASDDDWFGNWPFTSKLFHHWW